MGLRAAPERVNLGLAHQARVMEKQDEGHRGAPARKSAQVHP
jgi:hypothetical protein